MQYQIMKNGGTCPPTQSEAIFPTITGIHMMGKHEIVSPAFTLCCLFFSYSNFLLFLLSYFLQVQSVKKSAESTFQALHWVILVVVIQCSFTFTYYFFRHTCTHTIVLSFLLVRQNMILQGLNSKSLRRRCTRFD